MARQKGTLGLSSNIEPSMNAPLDGRGVVNLVSDLTASESFPYFYEGMQVYVKEDKKIYKLVGSDPTVSANWVESGGGGGHARYDYSTVEKVVGTWIDGKPLYQKTVIFTNPSLNSRISLSDKISNDADRIWVIEAYAERSNDKVSMYIKSASDLFQAWVNRYSAYDHWDLLISSNEAVNKAVVTLQYTKTTD